MSDVHGSYPERLQQLKLTTLEERRRRGDAIEVFICVRGYRGIDRESLFNLKEQVHQKTRHQRSFMPLDMPQLPHAKLDLRKNLFTVRGAKLWNNLPSNVRNSDSKNIFKNAYDKHVMNLHK